ncbi:hypothetical protein LP43_0199 [Methylophaga thiooxydans]|uniref:Uncharacterized protein n=1 Tax=Methylophaga thiooxydans TaxID=392484 RepID=A0A0A0BH07_9GAMM|nr:hypothetical protein [Methylophaga thiooxydans]KGM07783.1 hypothetical protein LP43_0199 [Methylophaga thiooxydans]
MNVKHLIQTVSGLVLFSLLLPINAEPGGIVMSRDVPAQRWDVNRHTGLPTVINPSPVKETQSLNNSMQDMGMSELTDQQFSGITSNAVSGPSAINNHFASTLTNQLGGHGSGNSVSSQMSTVNSITSGLGGSISGSVGGATRSLGSDIRGALSDTLPGR